MAPILCRHFPKVFQFAGVLDLQHLFPAVFPLKSVVSESLCRDFPLNNIAVLFFSRYFPHFLCVAFFLIPAISPLYVMFFFYVSQPDFLTICCQLSRWFARFFHVAFLLFWFFFRSKFRAKTLNCWWPLASSFSANRRMKSAAWPLRPWRDTSEPSWAAWPSK